MNWDDLKCVLALQRSGSLDAAAKHLRMDATTIARRIRLLESHFDLYLVDRGPGGRLNLTEAGLKVAGQAEAVEQITSDLENGLCNAQSSIAGMVRVSAVPLLVNHLLIPSIGVLEQRYPDLRLHLDPENRNVSLINRETDIALRLARPSEGGSNLKTRRIGNLSHGLYVPAAADPATAATMDWIGYQDTMRHLPQAVWIQKQLARHGGQLSPLQVSDFVGAMAAVAAGLGKTVLPCLIADKDKRLRRLSAEELDLKREIWLVHRADDGRLKRLQVVCAWLSGLFKKA